MKTAEKIKELTNFRGNAALYKLSEPVEYDKPWDEAKQTNFIAVSAINELAHETYIFAADEDGKVVDWSELKGSYKNGTDHTKALEGAGYRLI